MAVTIHMSRIKLIVLTAIFLVVADNFSFFKHVVAVYPLPQNSGYLISVVVVFCAFLVVLFSLFNTRWALKPVLIASVLIASLISYFSNTYRVIMDDTMIQNILETNLNESTDLVSVTLFLYLGLLGILPAWLIYKVKLTPVSLWRNLLTTVVTVISALLVIVIIMFSFSGFYTSFLREHKPLRYYTNPTYAFYSAGKYVGQQFNRQTATFKIIAPDAKKAPGVSGRKLVIVVVGEAVRADHFGLNGYARETTPRLRKDNVINFPEMYSCGTTTAISVPCMFSSLDRGDYSDQEGKSTENVLDILDRAGVSIIWRDNNSSSKGVADRLTYEDYSTPANNPICDSECRDEGMLVDLQDYIDKQKKGDVLIVLHQMGNHGPAYYRRYPQPFEKYTPVCRTNQLEKCTPEEIGNAYDNAILYTDNFLAKTIDLLKDNDGTFQPVLIYISDHGESLGENGLYLHGMPYFMAPDAQKHVAAVMWFGPSFASTIDTAKLRKLAKNPYSQDNLFHTLLGLMRVETSVYQPKMDILAPVQRK